MAPGEAAIGAVERRTSAAIHELGERIGKLETGQALVLGRLDALATQLGIACADMKQNGARVDDHETRLQLREAAYREHILPSLERLRNLELKVAGGAFIGGAVIAGVVELVRAFAH